jgi:FAD/FMN-containing dehydrogenase
MQNLKEKLSSILPVSASTPASSTASPMPTMPRTSGWYRKRWCSRTLLAKYRHCSSSARQQRIPMTFRAAGTNLTGQAVTDGILVDISKHWDRYSMEAGGALLRAQPGIVGGFLNSALKPYGRRIGPDPASIDACMLGGILANNSGGMCCGVTENSYKTLHSMTFVLPNGFVLDSAAPDAEKIFESQQPSLPRACSNSSEEYLRTLA